MRHYGTCLPGLFWKMAAKHVSLSVCLSTEHTSVSTLSFLQARCASTKAEILPFINIWKQNAAVKKVTSDGYGLCYRPYNWWQVIYVIIIPTCTKTTDSVVNGSSTQSSTTKIFLMLIIIISWLRSQLDMITSISWRYNNNIYIYIL